LQQISGDEDRNIQHQQHQLANLLAWLGEAEPDIVCLQELKVPDGAFPSEAIYSAGYEAVWRGQPTYNGVAILSKRGAPIVTRRDHLVLTST
jgi:exodeoxyribonuclease III